MYNNDLTANSNKFEASYRNGKYGFTVDGTFFEIGGGGMPLLNYTNPLFTFTTNNLTYTATKECYILGSVVVFQTRKTISINGTEVFSLKGNSETIASSAIVPLTKINAGDVVTVNGLFESQTDVNTLRIYEAI